MSTKITFLIAFAAVVLAGCDDKADRNTAVETAQNPSEPKVQTSVVPPPAQQGAPHSSGLAVRQFNPIGEGSLTMGDKTLEFQVADCELDEVELPTEWTRDIYIVGAGKDAGRDFFIHIKRHKQGRRSSTSVTFTYAALPAAFVELVDMNDPSFEAMWQMSLKTAGGMSVMMKPDDLVVEGRSVRSVEPLNMVEKDMSARLGEGVLQINCS